MAKASGNRRMVPAHVPRAPTKIGDLPEDILLRVMSHLPTREAVRTCLLLQCWRDLWRSVPCISVSIEEFEGQHNHGNVSIEEFEGEDDDDDMSMEEFEGEDGDDDMPIEEFEGRDDDDGMSIEELEGDDDIMPIEEIEGEDDDDDDNFEPINVFPPDCEAEQRAYDFEREVVFKRFVNRLLSLRGPVALDEFRLRYSLCTPDSSDSDEANKWISHALQCKARGVQVVNRYYPLELDPSVFTSRFLNRLHIGSAGLVSGFFNQLQMGCPALEYLFLHDCTIQDLEIFSSSLKVLILSSQVYLSSDDGDQVTISAPSLISLSIDYGLTGARLPILKNMPALKTASVSVGGDIRARDADGIRQFLGGLCDVTSLDFCYWNTKLTMENNFQWCPAFSKLINLTLDSSFVNEDFYGLIVFLQNSPNLQTLTLSVAKDDFALAGELENRSFTCEQLQIVEIICWGTSEMLTRVIQFLYANNIRHDQMRITDRSQV